jgi:hypothetical protein
MADNAGRSADRIVAELDLQMRTAAEEAHSRSPLWALVLDFAIRELIRISGSFWTRVRLPSQATVC